MNAKRASSPQAEKEALRGRVRSLRQGWDATWVLAGSAAIQARVIDLPEFQRATNVACYLARAGEVRTEAIVAHCRRAGRRLFLPGFDAHTRQYQFQLWAEGAAMTAGPLGIQQPETPEPIDRSAIDFIVVPGMAFDAQGGRVGHGGGHYDRMLALTTHAFRAAVCFDEQVLERCPMEASDIRMDAIVTPLRVLRVRRPN